MKRFAFVLAAAAILAAFLPTAGAANVSFTLKAHQSGWDFGEPGGSNPTLTVDEGDTVTITIQWVDLVHNWALYPGGTAPSDAFPGSSLAIERTVDVTSSSQTASVIFSAPPPGSYEYYCEYHAFTMHGTFVVRGNAAPAVAITAPTAAASWTGGTTHDITFTVSDDKPLTGLTAWVNYTSSVQSGTIASAFAPSASNTVPWDVPSFDATDVRVNVTVVDSQGAFTYRESAAFEIDSTRPTVTGQSPTPGQTDVARNTQVRVTFSEGMDEAQTGGAATFGVLHVPNNEWILGAMSWSAASRILTFTPSALLDPLTTYRAHVNTSAEDASDPGNTLLQPEIWNFITGSATDTTAPTIGAVAASPSTRVEGGYVNITADVTDDTAVDSVTVRVVGPDLDVTLPMVNAGGTIWYVNRTYATRGNYSFTVTATDTSGNARTRGGTFTITVPLPPSAPDLTPVYVAIGALLAIVIAALAVLMRRRKKGPRAPP